MKKDFVIILILLIFAVIGVCVSCTGTETGSTAGNPIERITSGRIDSTLLVAANDETAAMGCLCRKARKLNTV